MNKIHHNCLSAFIVQLYIFDKINARNVERITVPKIVRLIKSRRLRWAGNVARMGEMKGSYRVFVGKPEGKRSHGISRLRWECNIKMDLQKVGCGSMDWIEVAQDRNRWRALVNAEMNLRVP